MEKKKIAAIYVLIILLSGAIFFGVREFGKSSKSLEISNLQAESQESELNASEINEQQSKVGDEQSLETINQEDDSENLPVITEKEEEMPQPKEIEKRSEEKKVIESEPAETKEVGKIVQKLISGGFQKSAGRKIDTVIVHTSYNSLGGDLYDGEKIIDIYKQYGVSAHYLISRDGVIYQLVADQDIAWHAGVSEMPDGRKNVNDFSIGIEVINSKDDKFTSEQYSALNSLIATLKKKNEIKYILGHDEIAPGRKTDPWGIQWNKVNR